jgi:hypothetical protein
MKTTTTIDWVAVDEIAARLGARTRRLVADRDRDAVNEWGRRMAREHQGPAANTYLELAVLLAPAEEVPDDAA